MSLAGHSSVSSARPLSKPATLSRLVMTQSLISSVHIGPLESFQLALPLSPSLTPPLVCPMGLPRVAMFTHPTHLHIVASNRRCSSRSSDASGGMSAKPRAAWRGWARGSTSTMSAQCRRTASYRTQEWHARRLGLRLRHPRETLNDFDQLLVRSAPWVAKLIDRMSVRSRYAPWGPRSNGQIRAHATLSDRNIWNPGQLDVVWAWREALQEAGIVPIPRFTPSSPKSIRSLHMLSLL